MLAELPRDVPVISAMTTDAERLAYYRMAKDCAGQGAIVELGAWLGASTAYLAAGIRDSGAIKKNRVYVYDRWRWQPDAHEEKNGGPLTESSMYREFKKNLGPLIEYVKPRQGEIGQIAWDGSPVALLVVDAPKRVAEICHVMRTFAGALSRGSLMSWQDFAHFPSFQIPACLYRMKDYLRFRHAVMPGTSVAFAITEPWQSSDIVPDWFAVSTWTADQIDKAWEWWLSILPEEWHARFQCGQAMFLHDIGEVVRAKELLLSIILSARCDEVLPKWRYLNQTHRSLTRRYATLFALIEREGLLDA